MKGITINTTSGTKVEYVDDYDKLNRLPIYNVEFGSEKTIDIGSEVEFDIVDEFSHPHLFENVSWGDGYKCSKINNYGSII